MTGSPSHSDAARRAVAQSLAIDAHTAAVVTALDAAGIPSVLLKGPSIARWLYSDGTPRPYGDTDLLVPDDRMPEVEQVLEDLGLSVRRQPQLELSARHHASDWARPDGSGRVDLHWTVPLAGAPERVWAVVTRDAEPMIVGGCAMRVGSEPFRALFVVLHALHHGPEAGKTFEDLHRAIEQVDRRTWEAACDLAQEIESVAALSVGLGLVPAGSLVAQRLGIDTVHVPTELLLLAESGPGGAITWARVFAQPTWRRRARLAWTLAFPSAAYLRAWDPGSPNGRGGLVGAFWRRLRRGAATAPLAARAHLRGRSGRS